MHHRHRHSNKECLRDWSISIISCCWNLVVILLLSSCTLVDCDSSSLSKDEYLSKLNYILRHGAVDKSHLSNYTLEQQRHEERVYNRKRLIFGRNDEREEEEERWLEKKNDNDVINLVPVLVTFLFDDFPQETGFTITHWGTGNVVTKHEAGFFSNEDHAKQLYTQIYQLKQGHKYELEIFDYYGDGLYNPGFYRIYYGTQPVKEHILVQGGQFTAFFHRVNFTVTDPDTSSSSSSSNNNNNNNPTISPAPTHAPTICLDESTDPWRVINNQRDLTPYFVTEDTSIPRTAQFCQQHTTYTDCTNERREDCHWQFLTIGAARGRCRVDPIATCLKNGNCVCQTIDFNAGTDTMGQGLLFHSSISLTTRDLSRFTSHVSYYETFQGTKQSNTGTTTTTAKSNHAPLNDDSFFISRVDFTGRLLTYTFHDQFSPVPRASVKTISFNLHYLYWDVPLVGTIWNGLGYRISINTSLDPHLLSINGKSFPIRLKKWTCTTVVITPTHLYVSSNDPIQHNVTTTTTTTSSSRMNNQLSLGKFTGELFDVRIYKGTLNPREVGELGARCTTDFATDPAALKYTRDVENPYFIKGCGAGQKFQHLHAGEGGLEPTHEKQTYGSTAFATLWLRPQIDPFASSDSAAVYADVSEGQFDQEWFFQHAKLQQYLYERVYFETDMIGFNQDPYRNLDPDRVPIWSETFWDNPCRYFNNFNNGWQFPIYGNNVKRFQSIQGNNGIFDLEYLYKSRDIYGAMPFWMHEMFHGVQGNFGDVYSGEASRWMAETTAEYIADLTFPSSTKVLAPMAYAPAFPLGFLEYRDADRGQHFLSPQLSVNRWIRGGTVYASWILWWFLSEFAGLPGAVGYLYSNWHNKGIYYAGEIFHLREYVENHNLDFGDVWSVALAHMRTWDLPNRGDDYRKAEADDFEKYKKNKDIDPPIPPEYTVENRRTTVEIDPVVGTDGTFVSGPPEMRPGPLGSNCLTMRNMTADRIVAINILWQEGMGFQRNQKPSWIRSQQRGCDNDVRFYRAIVIAHDVASGQRHYYKARGKIPRPIYIRTTKDMTIHILLVPTPPADYIHARYTKQDGSFRDDQINPIPFYSYRYRISVHDELPLSATLTNPEPKRRNGIIAFDEATMGWWPVRCTCIDKLWGNPERCVRPKGFDGVGKVRPWPPKPQTPTPPPPPSFPSICFSGDMHVETRNGDTILLSELQIGTVIRVGNNHQFGTVYSFGHVDPNQTAEFIRLEPSGLTLSKDHMVFVWKRGPIPASMVRVGDSLLMGDSNNVVVVEKISVIVRKGVYAPFTTTGTIVVNGILASSYISFQDSNVLKLNSWITTPFSYHWLGHSFQASHRIASYWLGIYKEQQHDDGMSPWVKLPHQITTQWFLKQHGIIMGLLLIPLILLLCCTLLVEMIVSHPMMGIMAAVLYCYRRRQSSKSIQ